VLFRSYANDDPVNLNDPSGTDIISTSPFCWAVSIGSGEFPVAGVDCLTLGRQSSPKFNPENDPAWQVEWDNLSADCQKGLQTAPATRGGTRHMVEALDRALANMTLLNKPAVANGIDSGLLGAIALRETGFEDILQKCPPGVNWGDPKCSGAGDFQIDLYHNPGVSQADALNLSFAANWAANLLATNMATLAAKFPNLTPTQLLQATAASYNFGTGNISGNPATINVGSSGGNYGSNVLNLMDCFH